MKCVSGGAFENLLVQQKETVSSIEHIMAGSFYACFYDDEWYFGVVNYLLVENCDKNIKFLHTNGPDAQFFQPSLEDTCRIPIYDIITKVDLPSFGSFG